MAASPTYSLPKIIVPRFRFPEKREIALKVRFIGQAFGYYVNVIKSNHTTQEGIIMNENLPCTTSSGLQTFTGALFLFAIALALILVLAL